MSELTVLDLTAIHRRITEAQHPEDLFGEVKNVNAVYHTYALMVHEDKWANHSSATAREFAREAMSCLNVLRDEAERKIKNGTYGTLKLGEVRSSKNMYTLTRKHATGMIGTIYKATTGTEDVIVKVAHHPSVNNLLLHEVMQLKRIKDGVEDFFYQYFPTVRESFEITDEHKTRRRVTVFEDNPGYTLTAQHIRQAQRHGTDGRHIMWIGSRLFTALRKTTDAGVVHGAVSLDHLLIDPESHGLKLIGWGQSVKIGEPLKFIPKGRKPWYPDDVLNKLPVDSRLDVYLAAATLRELAGDKIERPLDDFLRGCLINSPHRRPKVDRELYERWRELAQQLYGPKKFVPFNL